MSCVHATLKLWLNYLQYYAGALDVRQAQLCPPPTKPLGFLKVGLGVGAKGGGDAKKRRRRRRWRYEP